MANMSYMKGQKMIKLFFTILSTALLTGCLGLTPNMQHYSNSTDVKDKAIMITELTNADNIKVIKFDENFNNKHRKEYKLHGIRKLKIPAFITTYTVTVGSFRQVVFVAEPGIYYISKASYENSNTRYYTALDGLTPEGLVIYGAFELKPGDVAYLGDIKFDWDDNSRDIIEICNNYTKVADDLAASDKYRDLVTRLKSTKFYAKDSMISLNEDGVYEINEKSIRQ